MEKKSSKIALRVVLPVVLLALVGFVLFVPVYGEVEAYECSNVISEPLGEPSTRRSVSQAAVLALKNHQRAGMYRMGKMQGTPTAIVGLLESGDSRPCAMIQGHVYQMGSAKVRLESVQVPTIWADLTDRRSRMWATFSVSGDA